MPFKSLSQRRKFHAMANSGEISKETLNKWEEHTPEGKLPEKVAFEVGFEKEALGLLPKMVVRAKGLGKAVSGWGAKPGGMFGSMPKVKNVATNMGNWMAKNPGKTLGIGAGAAGVAGVSTAGALASNNTPAMSMPKTAFEVGFDKAASAADTAYHLAELGGLGILAAPSIAKEKGYKPSEKVVDAAEIGGLGILAAPSAYAVGKKLYNVAKNIK